jgi:hypothetical protein
VADASSVKERAAAGEHEEPETDLELFPQGGVEGDGMTLGKIVKPGAENKLSIKLKSVRVPSRGKGLGNPEKVRTLLVTTNPGKVVVTPHMREGSVDHYSTDQVFEPTYVEAVQSGDAGRLEASFIDLLGRDPKGAAKALDAMQKKAAEVIGA